MCGADTPVREAANRLPGRRKKGRIADKAVIDSDHQKLMNHFFEFVAGLGGLLVPITALIVGGVIAVTAMILKHQERIAKIERGIDPDAPSR